MTNLDTADTAERIRKLVADAECRNCRTSVQECERLYAENAPDPIGCCMPHDHAISFRDVHQLAQRVETGEPDPTPAPPEPRRLGLWDYLNQGAMWHPQAPRQPLPIADMDLPWRWNASQFLVRGAPALAWRYGFAEVLGGPEPPDDVVDDLMRLDSERIADPTTWIRTTPLYRALVAGLPSRRPDLAFLAERARHWSTCAVRTRGGMCTCTPGRVTSEADIRAAAKVIKAVRKRQTQFYSEDEPIVWQPNVLLPYPGGIGT